MVALVNPTQTPPLEQVQARLPLVYFNHGYEAGYHRAVHDLLARLTLLSEEFMATRGETRDELRRVLYPFEEYLERRIERMTPDRDFVEGGLGI